MPVSSADSALFAHSGSDFGSHSGEVTSINKYIQTQSLQLVSPKRQTGVSQPDVTNHWLFHWSQ